MSDQSEVLIIDAGNTQIKFGVFLNDELLSMDRISPSDLTEYLQKAKIARNAQGIISSVSSTEVIQQIKGYYPHLQELNLDHKFPFVNRYQSKTLGLDRACNAAALSIIAKGKNALAIDIGTCIKFDFVDNESNYLGGSIAPGMRLRYKSLNDYTANLPLLDATDGVELIGNTTELAIQSGVLNGMQAEINDLMRQYQNKFPDLTFFMTGGDAKYFDFDRKSNIFANENLTLWGIYYVYLQNV